MKNRIRFITGISIAVLLSFSTRAVATAPGQKADLAAPIDQKVDHAAPQNPKADSPPAVDNVTPPATKNPLSPEIQKLIDKGFAIFIPKGTRVPVVFDTNLSSDKSHPGDEFSVKTAQDILLGTTVLVPKGSEIKGTVLDGQALVPESSKLVALQIRFESINSPAFGKISPAAGKLLVKGENVRLIRDGRILFLHSLFVTAPYRPLPPLDCNAFKADKKDRIEIATGDKFDFEFSADMPVSPH